jgi:NAD(P)-dependent dehydrogenase (short-subunit alcohol dehydrogenase family)
VPGILGEKTILVTGAGSGIGRSIAVACAAEGARVCVADLHQHNAEATVKAIEEVHPSASLLALGVDIRDPTSQQDMFEAALAKFGRLDGVVANAGILAISGPIHEVELSSWREMLETNLTGSFLTISLGAKLLVRQGLGGVILATGSSTAIRANPAQGAYVASKGGLHALMRVAALDLAPYRIRVNTLVPGQTDTPPLQAVPGYLERAAQASLFGDVVHPDELGRYAAFALSDFVSHMTGATLVLDSGRTIS